MAAWCLQKEPELVPVLVPTVGLIVGEFSNNSSNKNTNSELLKRDVLLLYLSELV